ncbi:hypothetical protein BOTBODRAFT_26901 [Botryobasidium botryosum FD-172 SS1]|uniref:Protein kinase domain-containing protein n=1 Tax=Botryobasidium botryosum (strain FD-172 SS1) TaxID=930990 RepID=A0A067MZ69_BOTB1|nr:hypothetical protein BOTBODRAFT_26901 [Botryobasidium botryosum FD-172 SS1]
MSIPAAEGLPAPERAPATDSFALSELELFWIGLQPFFESQGYKLRPRYQPGWVKSWKGTPGFRVEDAISPTMSEDKMMDATRISDGRVVVLKCVDRVVNASEVEIHRFLSQEDFQADERNHCVPLLDVLDPQNGNIVFLVIPLLRDFEDPKLLSVEDAIDFFRQTLEGIAFMHEKGVAHRDCARFNIMMDAKDIFPSGFHPQRTYLTPDASHWAPVRPRYQVPFPKYYFIDFGISTRFLEGESPLVTGTDGQDKTVPEFKANGAPAYDPFPVDIYILGNVYKNDLLSIYPSLAFLRPLVDRMTLTEPTERPSAIEALGLLEGCRRRLFSLTLYRRLSPVKENFIVGFVRAGWHLGQRATSRSRSRGSLSPTQV